MARTLYKSKKYQLAMKTLLNELHSSNYRYKDKIYNKLADIHANLGEYDLAKKYYECSIHENSKNDDILLKFGIIFDYHLNLISKAHNMYEKCLVMNSSNQACLFRYSLFMKYKRNNLDKSKELMIKCIQINNNIACVNYHLAKILIEEMEQKYIYNIENILNLLYKTIQLQPNIIKYHYELAIFLQYVHRFNEANHSYKMSLKLAKYRDASILVRYAWFLIDCMKNKKESMKYMALACELNDKYEHDLNELTLQPDLRLNVSTEYIKLIIYDFNTFIKYHCVTEKKNNSIQQLKYLSKKDLIVTFGGNDRIAMLKDHFDNIISIYPNVKFAILSFETYSNISVSLEKIGLYDYFNIIIGTDTSAYLENTKNKIYDILRLKDMYKIFNQKEVLYISTHAEKYINEINDECLIYLIDLEKNKPIPGPSLNDLRQIESIIKDPTSIFETYNNISIEKYDESYSLKKVNLSLFLSIQREIIQNKNRKSLYELKTMKKLIEKNDEICHNFYDYVKFGELWKEVITACSRGNWWIVCNLTLDVFNLEQNDAELLRKYAKSLSKLKHIKEAENAYNKALEIDDNNYWTITSYGQHLLSINKYKEAHNIFLRAIKASKYIIQDRGLNMALARTWIHLNNPINAEIYYKRAIVPENEIKNRIKYFKNIQNYAHPNGITYYEKAHYEYGVFLLDQFRYEEAEKQFEICLNNSSKNIKIHHRLMDISLKLNNYKKYKYHHDIINIKNNYLNYSKFDYKYINDSFNNVTIDVDFDNFWFDEINIITPTFNNYYDKFIEYKLNNMKWLLNSHTIAIELQTKINITDANDLKLILLKIIQKRCSYNNK